MIRRKAILLVLDGVGIGALPDAPAYGDAGSNTLAHTAVAVGGLRLPNLATWGLGNIFAIQGVDPVAAPVAHTGRMAAQSGGKDSTTGHWELAGVVVSKPFPTYPEGFEPALMQKFMRATGCRGYLGNTTASGTAIIQELGEEHVHTGFPIVYTSADSVFQIAAHEEVIPVDRLYEICEQTRTKVCIGPDEVGRVIARPFIGMDGAFQRTANRKDFSLVPPQETILDVVQNAGFTTAGIGKVDDLFANRGLSTSNHTRTNADGIRELIRTSGATDAGLIFVNLGDFDTLSGHRNAPAGFARALEAFDEALPAIAETVHPGDLLIITADHGNDPVTPSTDHSREYVPLLCYAPGGKPGGTLGTRESFADVAKTLGEYFGTSTSFPGTSFLSHIV